MLILSEASRVSVVGLPEGMQLIGYSFAADS